MTPFRKAALKTALVFFGAFVFLILLVEIFDFNRIIFNSFLFDRKFYQNPNWRYLQFLLIFGFNGVMGILGYMIAKKKNRNAQNWAGLCFLFSTWGVIFLSFLPLITDEEE